MESSGSTAMPSLLMAVALACVVLQSGAGLKLPRSLGLLGAAMLVSGAIVNWSVWNEPHLLAATLAGIGAVWVAGAGLMPRVVADTLGPIGATLGLGIYLSHVLFLRVFVMASEKLHVAPSAATDVAAFAFSLGGAVVLSWLLSRSRYTRWSIGL
ncbi:hypothetical protein EON77_15695 [bacterium]|nr:MAG: hypothetical protein EON77_15695 [bacterium]